MKRGIPFHILIIQDREFTQITELTQYEMGMGSQALPQNLFHDAELGIRMRIQTLLL